MAEKVAIVTAAGSGLGAGIARELAGQGWKVAVSSSSGKGEALGRSSAASASPRRTRIPLRSIEW